ncbi:MAG: hypothetical protein KatS3mg027_2402 [Bacteroidia bacterium]|nr:MAG: hypothetical protein KatS3mg027_2402 [Bacteroidia bacterium]
MRTLLAGIFVLMHLLLVGQNSIVGKWKTIDDETKKEKSIVEIYLKDNKLYGKVIKILTPGQENKVCSACEGENKNKPIVGMVIIDGLTLKGDEWTNGTILDPNNGKKYNCYLKLLSPNLLKVRGYIGFSLIGRTQYWYRVE